MSAPVVHIYDYGDWAAVYIDGVLKHWHDAPSVGTVLKLLGIECHHDDLPECLQREADDGGSGSHWSPPKTLDDMKRRVAERAVDALDAEIAATRQRLKELKEKRGAKP